MATTPASDRPDDAAAGPRRELSLADTTAIIVGIIIGSGLYETAPLIAAQVPGMPELLLVWTCGGLLALVGSLCYAELATTYPEEGGDYVYLSRAFGRPVGFLFAWAQLWVIRPGSIGALALVFARYANRLHPLGDSPLVLEACIAVALVSTINVLGVRQGKWVQNLLTVAKVLGLCLVIGMALVGDRSQVIDAPREAAPSNYLLAMVLVMFAYSGWNEMPNVAAEVCGPKRNILRALMLGTVSVMLIYLAFNASLVRLLGYEAVTRFNAPQPPVAVAARQVLGGAGALLIAALVAISALGAINGMTFTGSRIYYAMGRGHPWFAWLGRWNPRFGTPVRSLFVEMAVTIVMLTLLGRSSGEGTLLFERLVNFTAPLFYLFLGLSACSLVVLRRKDPERERPFRAPLYPLPPLVLGAVSAVMLWSSAHYAYEHRSWEVLWPAFVLVTGAAIGCGARKA